MKALLVVGSMHEGSHTRALVETVEQKLRDKDVATELWDLLERPVPLATLEAHNDYSTITDENMNKLIYKLGVADMIVLGTPLYHGSYSGLLKNMLDYLAKDELREKPVGLVCNGGGNTKTTQAMSHLTNIVHTLYGIPMQTQIGTARSSYEEVEGGFKLADESVIVRCERLAEEMIKFHTVLSAGQDPR